MEVSYNFIVSYNVFCLCVTTLQMGYFNVLLFDL